MSEKHAFVPWTDGTCAASVPGGLVGREYRCGLPRDAACHEQGEAMVELQPSAATGFGSKSGRMFATDVASDEALLEGVDRFLMCGGSREYATNLEWLKRVVTRLRSALSDLARAAATLSEAGYTDNGGERWKPPLGKPPNFDLLAAKDAEIAKWAGLPGVIAEIGGYGDGWPSHGNAPLAIAASYSLLHTEAVKLRQQLAEARELDRLRLDAIADERNEALEEGVAALRALKSGAFYDELDKYDP
jgi:hypothetical protein